MPPLFALILAVSLANISSYPLTTTQNETNLEADIQNILDYVYPNDSTLEKLENSVKQVNDTIGSLIDEININGAAYLENLEIDLMIFKIHISNSSCLKTDLTKDLKASFTAELNLLEFPVRNALVDVNEKFGAMKRSFEMERATLQLNLTTCFLAQNPQNCSKQIVPVYPCLNESCSPPQKVHLVHTDTTANRPVSKRMLLPTECANGMFKCRNGECKTTIWVCDGENDCSDGSDEGSGCTFQCAGVNCRNLKCITEKQICNGVDDCGDGTDEKNCYTYTNRNCSLTMQKVPCKNRKHCIYLSQMCDGVEDCNDGSDEGESCSDITNCSRCKSAGGSCLRTGSGLLCLRKCPLNFVLDLENGVCVRPVAGLETLVMYEDNSFLGTVAKLKLLFNRLSTGLNLLKKHMNYLLEKMATDVNNCMYKADSLNNPFLIE